MDDNDEIGTIWFERVDPGKLSYVLGIYLNRIDLFGKGVGRKVIKSAIDTILFGKNVQGLYLHVRKENIRAIRCYEKLGFKTIYEGEKTTSLGKIKFQRKQTFPNADQVGKLAIFNVGGNKARLITAIHYNTSRVYIRHVLTHKEYDRGTWKEK